MAGVVEADIWERVAAQVGGSGLVHAFLSDLSRIVDGREVGPARAYVEGPEPARNEVVELYTTGSYRFQSRV